MNERQEALPPSNNNNNNNNNQHHHSNNHNNNLANQENSILTPQAFSSNHVNNSNAHHLNESSSNLSDPTNQLMKWSHIIPAQGSAIPPPRSGAASVVVKGRLYMFGGYGGGTGRLDDFYSFSFETQTWDEVQVLSKEKPGCRENNGVVIGDSSRVYLFGGYNGTAWLNDLWVFDIDTKKWECIQESSDDDSNSSEALGGGLTSSTLGRRVPSRRFGYVSVVHDNKFVLFGGFDGLRWLNDMYEFDFHTKTWTEIHAKGTLPSVRSCPAWAKDEHYVYIQGGYDGVERKADFFAYHLKTCTWKEMPCYGTPPSPRYFHSCCLYGDKMFAYGGYSGSERLADMFAYDFKTGHWFEVNCSDGDQPSGRSSLVAQVYKNCLYIFGGYNGLTVLNDFYKFRLEPVSIPPPVLVSDLSRLINNPEYSDVTFLIEGKEVYANKAILSIRCEFFKVMLFSGGWRESISENHQVPIKINDISYEVFQKILHYLYTDTIQELSLDIGVPLLIASERFMLDRLKSLCEDHISRNILMSNVIPIYIASYRHNAKGLSDIALEFILNNLHDPLIIEGLSELKTEPDLLVEIIKRKAVIIPSSESTGPFGNSSEWSGTRR